MNAFTQTFGGSPVNVTDIAYASYSFSANLALFWPQFSAGNPDVAARFMNMTASTAGLDVYMPDATLNSPGYDSIIFNAGSNSFNVVTLNGNAIVTIAPGQVYYVLLNNNGTQDGGWQTVQFGVGTGSANASALAGNGLLAIAGLLNVNLAANTVTSNFSITAAARAMLYVWTGGSGTGTLPLASSVGNGFVFAVANNGSGSLTIAASGSDTIDGGATSVFSQTQSGFIISNGVSWSTVGKGIQNTFAVSLLNLNVAGSSDVTETSAQAQNIIQQYTGALTGNINVIVPATVQLYVANNLTSGAFTLTVKTAAGTGIQVAQGSTAILYCDGTNVVNAFTASIGGTVSLVVGSVSAPSLSFQGSANTGIYSPAANQLGITAAGFDVIRFIAAASAVNYLQARASSTGNPFTLTAIGSDANIDIQLVPKGTGKVDIAAAAITGGTVDGAVIGGATPAAITGTTVTANTGFVGNVTGHSSLDLTIANNLSDVANATSARSNLGLGSAATQNTSSATGIVAGVTGSITSGHLASYSDAVGTLADSGISAVNPLLALASGSTAVTQSIGNSTTKIATTAFVNPGSSLGGAGYTKLPNGLILQWGVTGSLNSGSSNSISFPTSFLAACYSVVITVSGSTGQNQVNSNVANAFTTSGFTLYNGVANPTSFSWIAIGQ